MLALAASACESASRAVPAFDATAAEPQVRAHLDRLRDVVRAHPDSAAAWGRLALSLQAHGYPEAAISSYAVARDLRPETFAYLYLPALLLADRQDADAGELLRKARDIREDYTPLLLREAEWLLSRGRPEEARRLIAGSPAERSAPTHTGFLLARAALALGDTSDARRRLEAVVEAEPGHADAHGQLAELYRLAGDGLAAELARERARLFGDAPAIDDPVFSLVAAEGISSRWHLLRGESLLDSGEAARAVEEFAAAVRILPDDAHAANLLGTALEAADRLDDAIDAYRRAVALRPGFREATANLARLLFRQGERDAATGLLDDQLAADSSFADAYLLLGMFQQSGGRPDRAIEIFVEGLRRGEFDPRIAIRLAWILSTSPQPGLRNGRSAVALAERVCAIEMYRDPASLDVLGAAYAEYGDFDRARATAARAALLARRAGDAALAETIEDRLGGYERRVPYRR